MKPILSVPIKNGAIAGGIGFVLIIILYYLGKHPFLFAPQFDFRIFLFGVFLFFTLKEFREYYNNGVLYFWQGSLICMIFIIVYGAIVGLGVLAFSAAVPDFVSEYITLGTEQLSSWTAEEIAQIGKDVYERNLMGLPSTDGVDLAINYFIQGIKVGLLISILLSVILRKQPKQ